MKLELSYWLADAPGLHFDWLTPVWLPAAPAASAFSCASRAAANATTMLRHRLMLQLLHAAARAAGCCLLLKLLRILRLLQSSFIIAATLFLQPHLFSATLFVNLELSYWLADAPVLQSDWLKLVWLPAAAAAAAPGCASCAAADATMMLRHLLLLLLLHVAACVAAVCSCCFFGCCGCCCKQLLYCNHTFAPATLIFSHTICDS